MVEELLTRARIPGRRRGAVYAGTAAIALLAGVIAASILPPDAPVTPAHADRSWDLAQQQLTRVEATRDQARADGRADLRQAETPISLEQEAWRLARAHGDTASALRAAQAVTDILEHEKARLPGGPAAATAAAPGTATAPRSGASDTPLAALALVLGLGAASVVVSSRRRASVAPVAPLTSTTAGPLRPTTVWTCEISWGAGLRGSGFRAVASAPGRRSIVIARSPNVDSSPFVPPVPEGEALAAARGLVRRLRAAGWRPTTRARYWYSQRFDWPGAEDPEPLAFRRRSARPRSA